MSDYIGRISALCLLFCSLAALSSQYLFAQSTLQQHYELDWMESPEIVHFDGKDHKVLHFDKAAVDLRVNNLPYFTERIKLPSYGSFTLRLENREYGPVMEDFESSEAHAIGDRIIFLLDHSYEAGEVYAEIKFCPLLQTPSGIRSIRAFDLVLEHSPEVQSLNTRDTYNYNSVLNQGEFYKIQVSESGIHKIDKALLEELSIDVSSIRCSDIRIYGNGGGMLPEPNDVERTDDLGENPILVEDKNGNNQFDDDDYILFFAEGADEWVYNPEDDLFEHKTNLYSDMNYYFLNFDLGQGLRIATAEQINQSPTSEVDSYTYLQYHETEIKNPLKSGRYWLGEEFSAVTSQDFNFQTPDFASDEATKIGFQVAGRSESNGSQFQIYTNGSLAKTVPFSYINIGSEQADYCRLGDGLIDLASSSASLNINLQFNKSNSSAKGWLDYINLNSRRKLKVLGSQFAFRDQYSVSEDAVTKFNLSHSSSVTVWDVSDIFNVRQIPLQSEGGGSSFIAETNTIKEFVCFTGTEYLSPQSVGKIERQNLHQALYPDLLIITHPDFLSASNRLADFHREEDGMIVQVCTIDQVFNEFSSGRQDIGAIRDMAKLYRDRAVADGANSLKYLQLVGDASYDFKNIKEEESVNTNFVPTFQSINSFNGGNSYCTDDFFALLDDSEGGNLNTNSAKLDIAVGRLPVSTPAQAEAVVDKLIHYKSEASMGDWQNNVTFIADDPDSALSNTHFNDVEYHTAYMDTAQEQYNVDKIYLDAFEQVSTSGESRYPTVTEAISRKIFVGTSIVNYAGHGGPNSWTQERILDIPTILSWQNKDKLPLFVTATCSFSRYDDPGLTSAGEELVLNPNGGCFSIVTTVRLVYSFSNRALNYSFLNALYHMEDGEHLTLGEAMRRGKNNATQASADNNRKFVLLGDPAITMNFPKYNIRTLSINGASLEQPDTLRALQKVTVTGQVEDSNGNLMQDFNGTVYPTVFDRKLRLATLGNDYPAQIDSFDLQKNAIFKGVASVTKGAFEFSFIVPKDISFEVGPGRISYYAKTDEQIDANGFTNSLKVGGIDPNFDADNQGPEIDLFLNDRNFVFGGLSNDEPLLLVDLFDENGINTVGTGIGHDVTAKLDEDNQNTIVLNDFYQAELDNYQRGTVEFPMSKLESGRHVLEVTAWDVYNNSGKALTEFVIAETADLALEHVLNYPNPFTDNTAFWFEHNYPGQPLTVQIQIFTVSGKIVKTINEEIISKGTRINDITWDGRDDYGNKIGRGVYVYKLNVQAGDNQSVNKLEKLVILK